MKIGNGILRTDAFKFIFLSIIMSASQLSASTVTFSDTFNSQEYNKNDGPQRFSASWKEYKSYDSFQMSSATGYISIVNIRK